MPLPPCSRLAWAALQAGARFAPYNPTRLSTVFQTADGAQQIHGVDEAHVGDAEDLALGLGLAAGDPDALAS